MYILIDKNNKAYYSKMYAPLARQIGITRQTMKQWFKNPALAEKKGYKLYIGQEAPHYKKGAKFNV
jgi:Zn/Cd-binding protein ZinT